MTVRDEYVAALEADNENLRARIQELEALCGASFESPPHFQLTGKESTIFGLLLKLPLVRKEAFMQELYPHQQDEAEIKIVDVFICKLRTKLEPFGLQIETQWGQGYFMTKETKAAAEQLIAEANAR